jgi:hypothetical protein
MATMESGAQAIRTALGSWSTGQSRRIPSPKQAGGAMPLDGWYRYYAGYPDAFVRGVLLTLPEGIGTILDPWNGAGTTTAVATAHGIASVGCDLHPAAVMIAKAKLLRADVAPSIAPLTIAILDAAASAREDQCPDDPLSRWFGPSATTWLRATERAAYRLLISSDDGQRPIDGPISRVSSLAALFYLGLFRLVRPLLTPFLGSNPTWVRRSPPRLSRIRPQSATLERRFVLVMEQLAGAVERAQNTYEERCPTTVERADSRTLPLGDDAVDAVITSPPYCTRIDYVVAMLPELAVLGMRDDEAKQLRHSMIGTVLTSQQKTNRSQLSPSAAKLIKAIKRHGSKAAKSYYAPFYDLYFRGMQQSIREISRVTRPSGPVVLVAQDSHFKELRVDLASIIAEMGEQLGWKPIARADFASSSNRARMHPHRSSYRRSSEATETVLVFENGA